MRQIGTLRKTSDLARLLSLQSPASYSWGVLLRRRSEKTLLDDLNEELQVQLKTQLRVIDANGRTLDELSRLLRKPAGDPVLIKGLDHWNAEALAALDVYRSALSRPGVVFLLLASDGLRKLFQHAPNLRSWIGGNITDPSPPASSGRDSSYLQRIRQLINQERLVDARRLLREALRADGENEALLRYKQLLAPPTAKRLPLRDVDRTAESQWIEAHREEYLGRWVALRGDALIAHAASLKELRAALETLGGSPPPLIHRIE